MKTKKTIQRTGNIGYTRGRKHNKNNPENWQYRVHKTMKTKKTIQRTGNIGYTRR
jgi:hypothetical protein